MTSYHKHTKELQLCVGIKVYKAAPVPDQRRLKVSCSLCECAEFPVVRWRQGYRCQLLCQIVLVTQQNHQAHFNTLASRQIFLFLKTMHTKPIAQNSRVHVLLLHIIYIY